MVCCIFWVTITRTRIKRRRWKASKSEFWALQNFEEALNSEIVKERGMVATVEHPQAGSIKVLGSPLNFSDTPIREFTAAPLLGADTDDVLRCLGYDDAKINALREAGTVN